MFKTKKAKENQKYEKYWNLTVEYTDIFDLRFNNVLRLIVEYIDNNGLHNKEITRKQYSELQKIIGSIYKKSDAASTRKSINQFLKMGFINNRCSGYHSHTKKFINEKDKNIKISYFSRIVYDNSSFNRSVTTVSDSNEYKFLLKTLEECMVLTKDDIAGIMLVDIEKHPKGYLTKSEVDSQSKFSKTIGFQDRKYNQLNYIFNFCKYLSGVYFSSSEISIDPNLISQEEKSITRDPYLQRIYKEELLKESVLVLSDKKCFIEKLAYPVLIASHIKPYRYCDPDEAFDVDNGLLLSKNIDSLFDLGYITFDSEGKVICSKEVDNELAEYLSSFSLDGIFINEKRERYMEYHRINIFKN